MSKYHDIFKTLLKCTKYNTQNVLCQVHVQFHLLIDMESPFGISIFNAYNLRNTIYCRTSMARTPMRTLK